MIVIFVIAGSPTYLCAGRGKGNPDPPFFTVMAVKYIDMYLGGILGGGVKGEIFLSDWYTQSNTYDVQLDITGITDTKETEFQVALTQNCCEHTGKIYEKILRRVASLYEQNPQMTFEELKAGIRCYE